ncbi:TldD/PmbA family protein [Haloimpatiens sp. FM7330]|uniref:TldD/PmbA family protein n=1 Tax=Haloimpatiens sp. FM7330 TaxID=3298610 RepID=UPI00363BFA23
MKTSMSKFLVNTKPILKKLVSILSKEYKYVSILGTDVKGKSYAVKKTGIDLNDSFWNERGFVLRIHNGINYSEFSFNEINESDIENFTNDIKYKIKNELNNLKSLSSPIASYPIIDEEKLTKNFIGEIQLDKSTLSDKDILNKMIKIKDKGLSYSDLLVDFRVILQNVHVSKIFISNNKDLEQSYVWSEGYIVSIARKDNNTKVFFKSSSGLKGLELLDEIEQFIQEVASNNIKLLDAKRIESGEYDVICDPSVSGLIAHEAFGHGVEMDMFVKNRAKAKEYINKPVASNLVTMHDGAAAAKHVSSYLFDDEGVLGSDTTIIDDGILKTGMCDALSALRLGINPTGNGKRESFERKAYTRMTNTFFESGNDDLEDMISSIKYGYLLECPSSGMEDPKNWGIQCMVNVGREIKDGKLTGKIVSPIVLTGYVPDLLKSISMVSKEVELEGSGACGKGYKEYVKVSCGGPYIKAKVRLG